ncbi:MAG: inositol monophosphatase family protein [Anderseniella sp.]|nr:inositol monophosphatase family protein [Anderseniella sp.]
MTMQPNGPDPAELDTMLAFAIELAELAARPALQHFRSQTAVLNKLEAGFDPVTAADRQTELVLREAIASRFPDHGILGEEHDEKAGTSPWRWVVDPIDGTRSFICGTPTWMTLIGLEYESQPVVGVASQPFTGEIFAGNGHEAFVIRDQLRHPLRSTSVTALADVLAGTTGPEIYKSLGHQIQLERIAGAVRHLRFDADAYFHCMVAAGQLGISLDTGLKPYDIAALIPIVKGAGGIITTWTGHAAADGGDIIAAGNPHLHEAALKLLG